MDWTPVTKGRIETRGVHPRYRGLVVIEVELRPTPPDGWAQCFASPDGLSYSLSMHPPELRGHVVVLTPPDAEVEEYVRHLDTRIAAANASYETNILPRLRAKENARREAEEAEKRRLDEVRRKLGEL